MNEINIFDDEKEYEFHELAKMMFPFILKPNSIKKMTDDIKKNGLYNPIWLYKGKIIDGKVRYLACRGAGVKPIYRNLEGEKTIFDLMYFLISMNIGRYEPYQRAFLAVTITPIVEAENTVKEFQKQGYQDLADSLTNAIEMLYTAKIPPLEEEMKVEVL